MNILKKHEFYLKDLDCAACANKIQNKLSENEKNENVVCNFNTLKLVVETEELEIKEDIIEPPYYSTPFFLGYFSMF